MKKPRTVSEWMTEQGLSIAKLVESSGLDERVVSAIVAGRYTTSPKQRDKLANILNVSPKEIQWGQAVHVDHMYGHGPQFGRSP